MKTTLFSRLIRLTAVIILFSASLLPAGGFPAGLQKTAAAQEAPNAPSLANSMTSPRYGHTGTLLPDGTILVTGGKDGAGNPQSSVEIFQPATGAWISVDPMQYPRSGHTATLLPTGQVLVVGGDGVGVMKICELYDPVNQTWSTTGSLQVERYDHTATLLADGRVLVAGGYDGTDYLKSSEIFNPQTGVWSPGGDMVYVRANHTATLLPDETVLLYGGKTASSNYIGNWEVYDPGSGWTSSGAGELSAYHTATLLANGKVLMAGGQDSSGYLDAARLFTPGASNPWTDAHALGDARGKHSATLLPDGQVLVAGGQTGGGTYTSSIEVYDPENDLWNVPVNPLASARSQHTATLLADGRLLVAGGCTGNPCAALNSTELLRLFTGSLSLTDDMDQGRALHTATLLPDGRVLVAGGSVASTVSYLNSAEIYDPVSQTWSPAADMHHARDSHTATLLADGKVLVTGGWNPSLGYLASAELYDPLRNTWTETISMTVPRAKHTATLLADGRVLVVGGLNGFPIVEAELYDPQTGSWSPAGSIPTGRYDHTATLLPNGKVLVAGGFWSFFWTNIFLNDAWLFDPASGGWSQTGSMVATRTLHAATLRSDGKVMVAGGAYSSGIHTGVELYDPGTGSWSPTGSMISPRMNFTLTLLPSGEVLASGGDMDFINPFSTEVYDPSSGSWRLEGGLPSPRSMHTATLLPDGTVLITGGRDGTDSLASATLYDRGLGYDPSRQPWLDAFNTPQYPEASLQLKGSGWRGDNLSEASSSNTSNSATNYPLAQLQSLGNDQVAWLLPDPEQPFTDSSYQSLPITGFPPGYARLTVFVNAIPSQSQILLIKVARHAPIAHDDPEVVLFSDGFEAGFSGWQADGLWNLESQSDSCGSQRAPFPDPTQAAYYGVDGQCNYDVGYTSGSLTMSGTISLPQADWAQLTLWSYEQTENYYYWDRRYVEAYSDQGPESMLEGRGEHTANLLPDGRVLVAGGVFPGYSTSAEIYDPATGVFTYTGAMNVQRRTHTATSLQDGRVLVVGGMDVNNIFFDSAEIFDPATGVFTYTGSLRTGRNFHTATRLLDGKVLVTGGFIAGWSIIDSAEIYDPVTGVFTDTDSMDTPRVGHTATLLPDGKVLVVGGRDASNIMLASAEIYDPVTGLFTPTGAMSQARDSHTATPMFDGKVLVIGGRDQNYYAISSAEIYDPETGIFTPTGSMGISRHSFSAARLPDGRVLVAGGYEWDVLASAEIYDPAAGTFSPANSMQVSRSFFPAVALQDGSVLVIGGVSDYGTRTVRVELFLPNLGKWQSKNWNVLSQLQNESGWYEASLDMANFLGRQTRLRFRFDTIDGAVNNYFGWMVDQVTVRLGSVYTTLEDTPLSVAAPGVLGNDFDLDGDPLSASPGQPPAHGVLDLSLDGSFTYTPEADYYGPDEFTYIVSDGVLTDTARVMIEVGSVFDVDAGSNLVSQEGQQVSFNGQINTSLAQSIQSLEAMDIAWDFGDGATASGTLTPVHTYAEDGQYVVTLTVSEDQGAVASDTLQVSVSNVAPQLDPLPDFYVIPGAPLSLSGTFSDPGVLDAHILTVEWQPGDSQTLDLPPGVTAFQLDHTYPAGGVFIVSLSLVDDDGGQDSATFTVTAGNRVVLPVILR